MLTDPHDPRTFRRYVVFNPDGTVASTHDVDATVQNPILGGVDVTDLSPADFSAITIDPQIAGAIQVAVTDVQKKSVDVATASQALSDSQTALTIAQINGRSAVSTASAKLIAARAAPTPTAN